MIPSISNINLPLDTIEALAWGNNLDWGYNKHPPLSAFAVEIFYQIFGNQDWAYYFLIEASPIDSLGHSKISFDFFENKSLTNGHNASFDILCDPISINSFGKQLKYATRNIDNFTWKPNE